MQQLLGAEDLRQDRPQELLLAADASEVGDDVAADVAGPDERERLEPAQVVAAGVREVEARQLVEQIQGQRLAELERVAHLTQTEAKTILMTEIEAEVREDANRLVRQIEEEVKENAGPKAREIITATIQRIASAPTSEA